MQPSGQLESKLPRMWWTQTIPNRPERCTGFFLQLRKSLSKTAKNKLDMNLYKGRTSQQPADAEELWILDIGQAYQQWPHSEGVLPPFSPSLCCVWKMTKMYIFCNLQFSLFSFSWKTAPGRHHPFLGCSFFRNSGFFYFLYCHFARKKIVKNNWIFVTGLNLCRCIGIGDRPPSKDQSTRFEHLDCSFCLLHFSFSYFS